MLRRGYMSADRAAAFSTYFEAALGAFFFFFSFFLRITFWRQSSPPPLGAASAMVFRARRKPTFALVSGGRHWSSRVRCATPTARSAD